MINEHIFNVIKNRLDYTPTPEQDKAIAKLAVFVTNQSPDFIFLLKGYAGTGKTSLIAALVRALNDMKIKSILLAPTGRAAKVFSSYASEFACTIHKKIYRQKSIDGGMGQFALAPNMHRDAIFIVDEASMIASSSYEQSAFGSGNLLDDLMEYVKSGKRCKLIISGDDAQLPPVGFSISPALEIERLKYYGDCDSIELTEVVRQSAESGILLNATEIRKQIKNMDIRFPKFQVEGFRDIEYLHGSDLIEALSDAYSKYGRDETIILCRSNKRANKYNEGVRRSVLYMEEEIESGDRLMVVKNNYQSLKDVEEIDFIANGDMAGVRRIRKHYERYGMRYVDASLEFEDYGGIEIDAKLILDTLSIESASLTVEKSKELFYAVSEDYAHIGDKRKRYNAIREDPFFNALQVKFAYAVTCHKSQGGQWKCVFLDCPYFPDNELTFEDLRWFYTAVTRAVDKLYLVNFEK
jgi:exodeoxyribonuclease-5